jgi:hypothetical protein
VPLDRVRLTAAKSSLGRHGKLRLARPRAWTQPRPWKTDSASPDPRARTQPRPRKMVSASPDPGLGLSLGLGRRSPPRPTQGSDSASASEDGLRFARPRARTQPRPRKTDFASPDPRARTQHRPRKTDSASPDPRARTQPRHRKTNSASPDPRAQTRPRPRRSLCLARPRARTRHIIGKAIITLPLASSGYGEQDRRPIWLAPVKQVMMAPRVLHDDGGSQPLTEARRRQQGSDSCTSTRLKHSSDSHDIT